MIGWLKGQIRDLPQPGKLVLDVHGVGYEVETSLQTFFQLQSQQDGVALHIHTIVRDDAFLLFGFLDKQERTLFKALIKVNGVGPKLAMSILSSTTPAEFIGYIQQQNTSLLTKLPGIGKKTAERLLIEMKDAIQSFPQDRTDALLPIGTSKQEQKEAIHALEALGYRPQEATKLIKKIDDGNKSCEQLIREALQWIAKKTVV